MSTRFEIEPTCPDCGGQIEIRVEGSTGGQYCMRCDWAVVTTHLPQIVYDANSYKLEIAGGDHRSEVHLRTVAQLLGVNWLEARKLLLEQVPFEILTDSATNVAKARDTLEDVGLRYTISPPFPW